MYGFLKILVITSILLNPPKIVNSPIHHAGRIRDSTTNYIIIHYDSGNSFLDTKRYLIKKRNSYHYYIKRDGTIVKMIDPKYQANHAGLSFWDGRFNLNKYSISICLENIPPREYTDIQYINTDWLIVQLKKRYHDINLKNIVGHGDIATPFGRKYDPGEHFNWNRLFAGLDSVYRWE